MATSKYVAGFTYTDAELLALYRECLARISQNQKYEIDDRVFEAADLPEVRKMVDWLEQKVNAASYPVIGTLLARMVRAT